MAAIPDVLASGDLMGATAITPDKTGAAAVTMAEADTYTLPKLEDCDFSTIELPREMTSNSQGAAVLVRGAFVGRAPRSQTITTRDCMLHAGLRQLEGLTFKDKFGKPAAGWVMPPAKLKYEIAPAADDKKINPSMTLETMQAQNVLKGATMQLEVLPEYQPMVERQSENFKAGVRAALFKHVEFARTNTDKDIMPCLPPSKARAATHAEAIDCVQRGFLTEGDLKAGGGGARYPPSYKITFYGWQKQVADVEFKEIKLKKNNAVKTIASGFVWNDVIVEDELGQDVGSALDDDAPRFELVVGVDPATKLERTVATIAAVDEAGNKQVVRRNNGTQYEPRVLLGPKHAKPNMLVSVAVRCNKLAWCTLGNTEQSFVPSMVGVAFKLYPPPRRASVKFGDTVRSAPSALDDELALACFHGRSAAARGAPTVVYGMTAADAAKAALATVEASRKRSRNEEGGEESHDDAMAPPPAAKRAAVAAGTDAFDDPEMEFTQAPPPA